MVLALLSAVLAINGGGSVSPSPTAISPDQPNYVAGQSVKVESVNNPTYSFPGADDRTVINGRLYNGRVIIGGVPGGRDTEAAHAAASYGAYGEEGTRGSAQVQGLFRFHPTTTVEFSPWTPVPQQQRSPYTDSFSRAQMKMALRAEDARQQWLKDNNYTGGVRTFVNDAVRYNVPLPRTQTQIEPRGVIEVSPETPAFKSRMQVRVSPAPKGYATPAAAPKLAAAPDTIKVLPKTVITSAPVEKAETVKVAQK